MPAVWNTPTTWAATQVLTASKLNEQVRDNLTYLFDRPRHVITLAGVTDQSVAVSTTTPTALNDTSCVLELTTTGGDVELTFTGTFLVAASNILYFDWLWNNTTYLSTGTTSMRTNGLFMQAQALAATTPSYARMLMSHRYVLEGVSAGVHNFRPRLLTNSASTFTFYTNNSALQLSAREI